MKTHRRETLISVRCIRPWHSLRHTFGTGLANAGVPAHLIKVLMGHKSI